MVKRKSPVPKDVDKLPPKNGKTQAELAAEARKQLKHPKHTSRRAW